MVTALRGVCRSHELGRVTSSKSSNYLRYWRLHNAVGIEPLRSRPRPRILRAECWSTGVLEYWSMEHCPDWAFLCVLCDLSVL
jgi:hypothetical protein